MKSLRILLKNGSDEDPETQPVIAFVLDMPSIQHIAAWVNKPLEKDQIDSITLAGELEAVFDVAEIKCFDNLVFARYAPRQHDTISEVVEKPESLIKPDPGILFADIVRSSEAMTPHLAWVIRELESDWKKANTDLARWFENSCIRLESNALKRVLRDREPLFKEFASAVQKSPIVFLVGGHESGINEFFLGFVEYVKFTLQGYDVEASFELKNLGRIQAFTKQIESCHTKLQTNNQNLTAFLATLAFNSCRPLVQKNASEQKGRRKKGFSIPRESLEDPELFAFYYYHVAPHVLAVTDNWQGGSPINFSDSEESIRYFLWFLSAATSEISDEALTVFMPFDKLSQLLRDEHHMVEQSDEEWDYYQPAYDFVESISSVSSDIGKDAKFKNLEILSRVVYGLI